MSLELPLELGVARELRIEGAMNGQGTMPDAQGNQVSYIFRGQGSLRQTITPHAQLVQWALGRRPASPAGQSQVRRPPDPASRVPAGQRPPAGPAGPAKKPVPTTVPPGRQPPPAPDTAPVPKGPDIPSY